MTLYPDAMLDLETMGGPPNGAIVGIGVVLFNLREGTIGPKLYRAVHLETSVRIGMSIDISTVLFWLRQSKAAQDAITTSLEPIEKALADTSEFLKLNATDDVRVWGNGPEFDNALLTRAYELCNIERPWAYWNSRCFRTVSGQFSSLVKYDTANKKGVAHNAIDDCMFQIEHMLAIRSKLTLKVADA